MERFSDDDFNELFSQDALRSLIEKVRAEPTPPGETLTVQVSDDDLSEVCELSVYLGKSRDETLELAMKVGLAALLAQYYGQT